MSRPASVSPDLKGPRGGGRERDEIVRHVNGTEIQENGRKVGVRSSPDAWRDPDALRAHREALCTGIREFNDRGPSAGSWWTVQSFIRRSAWHMLDHAWAMEDRDQSTNP